MKAIVIVLLVGISLSYNPGAAVSYARSHCNNYNPDYNNYKGRGGDCANFVSQCMHAGGQGFDGCGSRDNKGMLPGVAGLKSCLSSKGWKSYRSKPNNFRAGYPIFLKSGSHAMLATGVNGNTIVFCAHTNDRCDASISAGSVDFYSL